MFKLHRTLPLIALAALLSLPASASAVSSNGRADGRGSSSESRDDRDRSESRRDRDRSRSDRSDRRSSDRRSETRRSDSSEGRAATHGRNNGTYRYGSHASSGRSSSQRVVRTSSHQHRYGYGHRHGSRTVVVTAPSVHVHHRTRRVVRRAPAYDQRYYEPMYLGDRALDDVLYQLDRATFSSDKMAIIQHVARSYTYSTWAVEQMVRRLTFSNDRVDALHALYPRVHDKERWYRVYDLLTFSSDRDELRRRCR